MKVDVLNGIEQGGRDDDSSVQERGRERGSGRMRGTVWMSSNDCDT